MKYLKLRKKVNGHNGSLWLTKKGITLKDSSVETPFIKLRQRTGINVHPHLLRHTFATMWLKNGGGEPDAAEVIGAYYPDDDK